MINIPSIYSIQSQLILLSEKMDEHLKEGTELPLELEEEMSRALFQESEKIAACCSFFDAVDAELELAELQIKKLREYKSRIEKNREALLKVAKKAMIARNIKSLNGDLGRKISLRKSEVVECDTPIEKLDFEYVRTKYEIDRAKIKEALKKGEEIEGCRLVENQSVNWK